MAARTQTTLMRFMIKEQAGQIPATDVESAEELVMRSLEVYCVQATTTHLDISQGL